MIPTIIVDGPLGRGQLSDSLCCLYSIINALRLVLYPDINLDRRQTTSLFVHGVHFLSHADALLDTIEVGMDAPLWLKLCKELTGHVGRTTGIQVRQTRLLSGLGKLTPETALATIEASLGSGAPVLLMLMGGYDHCTVASGITDHRLRLFDSAGHKWIRRSSVGIHGSRSAQLHQIARASVVSLSVAARP